MAMASVPRILLCADVAAHADEVRRLLEQAGYAVTCQRPGAVGPEEVGSCDLIVVEASSAKEDALGFCQRLCSWRRDRFVPILFITSDQEPAARLARMECGADVYLLRPFAPGELLAQVRAFLRFKDQHDRLAEMSAEVHRLNKRLQAAYQQINEEMALARRIQQSFLPHSLPQVPQVSFAVHHRPCGRIGGDFYDLFRLDEHHLGFYLADAMGHGVPASLLTIFVKQGVRAKDIDGQQYRLVPPGEVLQRLNSDLIAQQLSENPFLTMVYALYNHRDRTLHFSRSGHPFPIYLPREGEPCFLRIEGSLLGVFETEYPTQTHLLHPGDKLLLYSDGIDPACFEDQPQGTASLMACAARHRQLPIRSLIDQLARDLFPYAGPADDLTVVGMEVTE
jgi:sigma-B regulation protein RsbU (phosphoserine phosphatase)